jgi:hypothetical protein
MLDHMFLLRMLFCFMGPIEASALRTLCKSVNAAVEEEPENSFNFTFAPVLQRLSNFTKGKQLLWVVHRMGDYEYLVQGTPTPMPHHWPCHGALPWFGETLHPRYKPTMAQRNRAAEQDICAFWFHPHVRALRTAAIRLDCSSLMRYVAKEASKTFSDGEEYFLYNFWVFIEEAHLEEHGPWEPLRADNTSAVGEHFFSILHKVLWTNMRIIRRGEGGGNTGYERRREYTMTCSCSHHDSG